MNPPLRPRAAIADLLGDVEYALYYGVWLWRRDRGVRFYLNLRRWSVFRRRGCGLEKIGFGPLRAEWGFTRGAPS